MEKHLFYIKQQEKNTCKNTWTEKVGISAHIYLSLQWGEEAKHL